MAPKSIGISNENFEREFRTKIEKRFEKHVPVRILRGSLAQSTREGRGSMIVLGA